MNTVKCNAKDPNSCRFHRPDAGVIAKAELEDKKTALAGLERRLSSGEDIGIEYHDARWAVETAETAYYGTAMGVADITEQQEKETDENKKFELEMKLFSAKHALAETERMNAINERNGGPLIPAGTHAYEEGHVSSGGNDLWPTTTGSKYERGMRAAQVKTRVNADIKEAQKKGYLPKQIKFSVRSSGDRLDVQIIGAAPEQIYNDAESQRNYDRTKQADELLSRVKTIVYSYQDSQYDVIEGRTNHTNFWESINFESSWDKSQREAKEAQSLARRTAKKEESNR